MIIVYVRHTDISFLANISAFEIDDEALAALREYALANNLYWAMAEGHACEISVCSLLLSSFHREYLSNQMTRLVATPWRTPPRTLVR